MYKIQKKESKNAYFTISTTWWLWDFSWWGEMSHVSQWASCGDNEISHGEEEEVIFHLEHHVTTMRFLMGRWDEPCFTISITWWPWDFSWWRGRSHITPWASRDDYEISHVEVGWDMFNNEHHVVTMRFLMVRWVETSFTMSITWRPWEISWRNLYICTMYEYSFIFIY